jgi:hypothetical protein
MINTTAVINGILPDLHAASSADLVFWDPTDLIRWTDECVKQLGRLAPVFALRDTSLTTVPGTAAYDLPARHIATIHVSVGQTSLRPANVAELEGLDPAFRTTAGPPRRWYEDVLPVPSIALAPVPIAAATIPVVYASFPPEVDVNSVNTSVPAPPPVQGYIANYILAEAFQKEGESEMPDVAAHCRGRLALYEQAFQQYFGKL